MKTIDEGNKPLSAVGTLTGGLSGSLGGRVSLSKPTGTGKPPWIERLWDALWVNLVIRVIDRVLDKVWESLPSLPSLPPLFRKPAVEK